MYLEKPLDARAIPAAAAVAAVDGHPPVTADPVDAISTSQHGKFSLTRNNRGHGRVIMMAYPRMALTSQQMALRNEKAMMALN